MSNLMLTVDEAAEQLRISRAKTFELVSAGEIESVKIGRRRLIPYDSLVSYVDFLREIG